jgi:hypothetical protein
MSRLQLSEKLTFLPELLRWPYSFLTYLVRVSKQVQEAAAEVEDPVEVRNLTSEDSELPSLSTTKNSIYSIDIPDP